MEKYPQLIKVYIALYANEIEYETYNVLIKNLGDITFKISPVLFKKAVYENYGYR